MRGQTIALIIVGGIALLLVGFVVGYLIIPQEETSNANVVTNTTAVTNTTVKPVNVNRSS